MSLHTWRILTKAELDALEIGRQVIGRHLINLHSAPLSGSNYTTIYDIVQCSPPPVIIYAPLELQPHKPT